MMEEQEEDTYIRAEINQNLSKLDKLQSNFSKKLIDEDMNEEGSSCHLGDNEGTHPAIL